MNAVPATAATTTISHAFILDFEETAPLACLYAGEDVPAAAVEVLETFAGVVLVFRELEEVTTLGDDEAEETEAALTTAGAGVVVDLMLDDVDFLEELTAFTLGDEDLLGEDAGLILEVVVRCFDGEDDAGLGPVVEVDVCLEEEDAGLRLEVVVECFEEEDGLTLDDECVEDDVCIEEDDGLTVELVEDECVEDDVCIEEDDGLTVELVEDECVEDEECFDVEDVDGLTLDEE
jgi:hypothetical protein